MLYSDMASAHLDFVNYTSYALDKDEISVDFYDNTSNTFICKIKKEYYDWIEAGEKYSEFIVDTWGLPELLPPGHAYKADIYVDSEFIISVPLYSGVKEKTYFKVENGKALPLFE